MRFPQTMTGQRFGKCIALCLLPWSCLSFAWSDAAGPETASPEAGHVSKGLPRDIANGTYVHSNISGTRGSNCRPLPLWGCSGPRRAGAQGEGRGEVLVTARRCFSWCAWRHAQGTRGGCRASRGPHGLSDFCDLGETCRVRGEVARCREEI